MSNDRFKKALKKSVENYSNMQKHIIFKMHKHTRGGHHTLSTKNPRGDPPLKTAII